jgi:hypothetical protein
VTNLLSTNEKNFKNSGGGEGEERRGGEDEY